LGEGQVVQSECSLGSSLGTAISERLDHRSPQHWVSEQWPST